MHTGESILLYCTVLYSVLYSVLYCTVLYCRPHLLSHFDFYNKLRKDLGIIVQLRSSIMETAKVHVGDLNFHGNSFKLKNNIIQNSMINSINSIMHHVQQYSQQTTARPNLGVSSQTSHDFPVLASYAQLKRKLSQPIKAMRRSNLRATTTTTLLQLYQLPSSFCPVFSNKKSECIVCRQVDSRLRDDDQYNCQQQQ